MLKIKWPQRGRPGLNHQILNFGNVWVSKKEKRKIWYQKLPRTSFCLYRCECKTNNAAHLTMGCWARGEWWNMWEPNRLLAVLHSRGTDRPACAELIWANTEGNPEQSIETAFRPEQESWGGEGADLGRTVWTVLLYYYTLECVSNVFLATCDVTAPKTNLKYSFVQSYLKLDKN